MSLDKLGIGANAANAANVRTYINGTMAIQSTRGTDAWIERISVQEMPALCATVRMLEKMAQDDNMSLADLGKSILHDNGLTTRILRVANSVTYSRGSNQVTTISRAVVLLGLMR